MGRNADKTHHSNYSGTPLLSTAYKIVFNIFLLRLPPCTEEIIGEHRVHFDVTGQEVTVYCIIAMTSDKIEIKWGGTSAIYRPQ